MRKILFICTLIASMCLVSACTDDEEDAPTLSFGRPIYILKAAQPLAVELMVSEPVEEPVSVPFTVSGSAVEGEDYTMEVKEFVLQPGKRIDTVFITPKDNVIGRREIRLALNEVPGFRLWNNRVAMIPVETKDVFTCSFGQTAYELKNSIVVAMNLAVGSKDYMYQKQEVRVPFEIDPASTAVLGEHYEIVGNTLELYMGVMKATADVSIRFLKKEVGKDKVILRLVEGGLFEGGTNASTVITIAGPTTMKDIEGTWAFKAFTSGDFVKSMVYGYPHDCDNLPINNFVTDKIVFTAGTTNTLNVDGVRGDLAMYLRNGEVTYLEEVQEHLYDQDVYGVNRDVMVLELSKANVNYSATNVSERKAIIWTRVLNKGEVLELRVIDYEPTDFLTGTYYDQVHGWGDPDYPMRDLYPLVFRFTREK